MDIIARIKVNKHAITKDTVKYVSAFYTLFGFVSLLTPITLPLPEEMVWWKKLLLGILIMVGFSCVIAIQVIIRCLNTNQTKVLDIEKYGVYIRFGDIMQYMTDRIKSQNESNLNIGRVNIVIPVNRCFDTIVDDNLISMKTLHGKFMQYLFDINQYEANSLNGALKDALKVIPRKEKLRVSQKPVGNLERYEVGTIAELKINEKLILFFLGLSKFDNQLQASTSKKEYVEAIQKLIEFCNSRSQGYPVILPLIGTYLSRTKIGYSDALSYMIQALKINRDIINCDFYIIVWDGDKDKISIKQF